MCSVVSTCSQAYLIREGIPDFILEELSQSKDPELQEDALHRSDGTHLRDEAMVSDRPQCLRWISTALLLPNWSAQCLRKSNRSKAGCWISPAAPAPMAGGLRHRRRRCSESTYPWGCFGKAPLTPRRRAFPTCISPVRRVEALPFENGLFDATLCCGSLHLFADTVTALREMARVMKPGAILAVFTFTAGRGGILKFRRVREWSRRDHGLHVFELPEMEQYLSRFRLRELPARSIWLHFDLQRSKAHRLTPEPREPGPPFNPTHRCACGWPRAAGWVIGGRGW